MVRDKSINMTTEVKMADVVDYQILGDDLQLVEIELDNGEGVRAEVGTMTYMEDGIEMQTGMGGDLFSGFKRMITGESFFITTFLNNAREKRHVAFAAPYPGKIVAFDLDQFNGQILCQKDSFLCAAKGTEIEVAFTKRLGAGFFGGLLPCSLNRLQCKQTFLISSRNL